MGERSGWGELSFELKSLGDFDRPDTPTNFQQGSEVDEAWTIFANPARVH